MPALRSGRHGSVRADRDFPVQYVRPRFRAAQGWSTTVPGPASGLENCPHFLVGWVPMALGRNNRHSPSTDDHHRRELTACHPGERRHLCQSVDEPSRLVQFRALEPVGRIDYGAAGLPAVLGFRFPVQKAPGCSVGISMQRRAGARVTPPGGRTHLAHKRAPVQAPARSPRQNEAAAWQIGRSWLGPAARLPCAPPPDAE